MFADDNPTIALLKPGDVLYIPPLWFHSVVSISPSYSVKCMDRGCKRGTCK